MTKFRPTPEKHNLISTDKPNALKAIIGKIYLIMYNVNSLCIQCHLLNKKVVRIAGDVVRIC